MPLKIDLQIAVPAQQTPTKDMFQSWADAAANACGCNNKELTIRIADEIEVSELNSRYRHKTGATNVLSFPFEDPPGVVTDILGDLVICAPVVQREADEQDKIVEAHWAHMLIHGVLHLCGYDHIDTDQAIEMETLETSIITGLGYLPPYDQQSR
ncbi:MAG: rRNA maturation RNase YbeY [Arenicellales bacterium]